MNAPERDTTFTTLARQLQAVSPIPPGWEYGPDDILEALEGTSELLGDFKLASIATTLSRSRTRILEQLNARFEVWGRIAEVFKALAIAMRRCGYKRALPSSQLSNVEFDNLRPTLEVLHDWLSDAAIELHARRDGPLDCAGLAPVEGLDVAKISRKLSDGASGVLVELVRLTAPNGPVSSTAGYGSFKASPRIAKKHLTGELTAEKLAEQRKTQKRANWMATDLGIQVANHNALRTTHRP
ncbi:MAG: hypothetical protein R3C68_01585 [Myxococcota bacterium]